MVFKKIRIKFLITFFLASSLTFAQNEREMTLQEIIELAQEQSLDAFISKNMYLVSYWQFKAYKAKRRPWLEFYSDPIDYSNSIETITDNTGTYLNRTNKLGSNSRLSLSQNFAPTGGKLSIYSDAARLEDYTKSDNNVFYSSSPVSIGITQPLFQYNQYKWEKKIEPLKFEKAKKEYIESVENVAMKAINNFFNLLDAEQAYKIAELNKATADTLYKKSLGRYDRGAISFNSLQRLELNMVNAGLEFERSALALERVKFNLKSFLRLPENDKIKLVLPLDIPKIKIIPAEALTKALENNSDILDFKQRMIEADLEIARARGQNGINSNLNVNLGWSISGPTIQDAYNEFDKDRGVQLGVYIPVIDWGQSKGQREMAKFNKEVETARIEIERIYFEQDVIMSAIEFNMLESQLNSAAKANAISENSYKTIQERFLLGKENLETLFAARNERDNALRSYYSKVREFWVYYYYMRRITLYDFNTNQSLSQSFDYFFGL